MQKNIRKDEKILEQRFEVKRINQKTSKILENL